MLLGAVNGCERISWSDTVVTKRQGKSLKVEAHSCIPESTSNHCQGEFPAVSCNKTTPRTRGGWHCCKKAAARPGVCIASLHLGLWWRRPIPRGTALSPETLLPLCAGAR